MKKMRVTCFQSKTKNEYGIRGQNVEFDVAVKCLKKCTYHESKKRREINSWEVRENKLFKSLWRLYLAILILKR